MDISKLDIQQIAAAMEDHSYMAKYYLDKEAGDVIPLPLCPFTGEEDPLQEEIDEDPSRYLRVETMPSRDSFRFMEEFVESLPDGEDKRTLERALAWKKPFSNFKNALYDLPEIREQWFAYKDECMRRYVMEWLEDIGEAG